MTNTVLRALAALIGVVIYLFAAALQAAPFEGRIVKHVGQVSVTTASGSAVDLGAVDNVVGEAQTIATGPNGRAVVSFNNGSITVLDPNSRLEVKKPNWFVHLAGKAFFTFKKLVGSADDRRVQNTVALIGIRGTEFISYEGAQTAVALDEGVLNVQTLGDAFNVTESGSQNAVDEFILDSREMVTFDAGAANVTAFTPEVIADLASFRLFGGDLLTDFSDDYSAEEQAAASQEQAAAASEQQSEEEQRAEGDEDEDDDASSSTFYVGVGAGLATVDSDSSSIEGDLTDAGQSGSSVDLEDQSSAGKIFVGYRFNPFVGVEVGAARLGEFDSEISASPSTGFAGALDDVHPVSPEGFYVAGVLRADFVLFALEARAGVFSWEGEVESDVNGSGHDGDTLDGTDSMFGVSVEPPLLPLRFDLERYDIGDHPIDVISANLVFSF